MEILINENAAGNYIKRCYKHARPEAYGLHNENFYNILKNVQGKWLTVETEHLFSDQFNTAPIENVSVNGVRIMIEDVVEIKDDIRDGINKCRWCYGYDKDNDGACDKCGKNEYLEPLKPRTI
jgi:hypothetical protein